MSWGMMWCHADDVMRCVVMQCDLMWMMKVIVLQYMKYDVVHAIICDDMISL